MLTLTSAAADSETAKTSVQITVSASIKPIHSIAVNILEGVAPVQLILSQTESAHHTVLKPSQINQLHQSDVLIYVSEHLETHIAQLIPSLQNKPAIIKLIDAPDLNLIYSNDHHVDPHIWLAPESAIAISRYLAEQFVVLFAEQENKIRANLAAFLQQIKELDNTITNALSHNPPNNYITLHNAYAYFENAYGIKAVAHFSEHPEHHISAKKLNSLHEHVHTDHVNCLFKEPELEPRHFHHFDDGKIHYIGTLDPLGNLLEPGKALYQRLMLNLSDEFVQCAHSHNTHSHH